MCLVTAKNGVVRVPVLNLGAAPCGWRRTRGSWVAKRVSEEEIEEIRDTLETSGTIGMVQPQQAGGELRLGLFKEELNINECLPPEEKEELLSLLAKRCFAAC